MNKNWSINLYQILTISLQAMPGNKNSGWRKSHEKYDLPKEIPAEKKKKPVCPKKNENYDNTLSENVENKAPHSDWESEAESEYNCIASQSTSQSHHVNLQNRSSDISRFYDTFVRMALENFPLSRLPLQWRALERYRSLQIDSAHNSPLNDIIINMMKEIRKL